MSDQCQTVVKNNNNNKSTPSSPWFKKKKRGGGHLLYTCKEIFSVRFLGFVLPDDVLIIFWHRRGVFTSLCDGTSIMATTLKQSRIRRVQLISVQFFDRFGRRSSMADYSVENLFPSFLQQALVISSGMGRDVHSLLLSIQHLLCRPRRLASFKGPEGCLRRGCRGVLQTRTMRASASSQ